MLLELTSNSIVKGSLAFTFGGKGPVMAIVCEGIVGAASFRA